MYYEKYKLKNILEYVIDLKNNSDVVEISIKNKQEIMFNENFKKLIFTSKIFMRILENIKINTSDFRGYDNLESSIIKNTIKKLNCYEDNPNINYSKKPFINRKIHSNEINLYKKNNSNYVRDEEVNLTVKDKSDNLNEEFEFKNHKFNQCLDPWKKEYNKDVCDKSNDINFNKVTKKESQLNSYDDSDSFLFDFIIENEPANFFELFLKSFHIYNIHKKSSSDQTNLFYILEQLHLLKIQ